MFAARLYVVKKSLALNNAQWQRFTELPHSDAPSIGKRVLIPPTSARPTCPAQASLSSEHFNLLSVVLERLAAAAAGALLLFFGLEFLEHFSVVTRGGDSLTLGYGLEAFFPTGRGLRIGEKPPRTVLSNSRTPEQLQVGVRICLALRLRPPARPAVTFTSRPLLVQRVRGPFDYQRSPTRGRP